MISRLLVFTSLCFTLIACSAENALKRPGVIELSTSFTADFNLIDHDGEVATDERFEGKPMLLYFGFASCTDVCPAALSVMSATLEEMGPDAKKIQPLFITIDPERDTPDVLKAHLGFDPRIMGLTGRQEQIDAIIKSMRVYVKKVSMPDSALGYSMDHQSIFFFVDKAGNPTYALQDTMAPTDMAAALKALVN